MLVMEEPERELASKENHPDSPLSTTLSSDAPKNDSNNPHDPISPNQAETNIGPIKKIDSKNDKDNIKISDEISDKNNSVDRNGDEKLVPENNTIPDLVEDKIEKTQHAEEMEEEEAKSDDIATENKSDKMSTIPEEIENDKVCEEVKKDMQLKDNIPIVTSNNLVITAHSVTPKSDCPSEGNSPKQFTVEPSIPNDAAMVEMNEDSGSSQEEGGLNLTTNRINRKRKSESFELPVQPSKKLMKELQENYQNHERILTEYIQSTQNSTMPDVVRHIDQLLSEIHTVSDMIKMKEQEWNNLIHLLKIKEEILMRLTRRKEILEMNDVDQHETNDISSQCSSSISNDTTIKLVTTPPRSHQPNINLNPVHLNNSGLMMVPIVTSNAPIFNPVSQPSPMPKIRIPALPKQNRMQHILPKPPVSSYNLSNQNVTNQFLANDLNGHLMGRQGPIKDVKSIIADYRQRHPEAVPRRGRRMKSILNPHLVGTTASDNIISSSRIMTSAGPLRPGLGTLQETRMSELGLLLTAADGNSRPSSADSSHSSSHTTSTATITPQHAASTTTTSNALSFKDALVEFAKMSPSERQDAGNRALLAQNTAAAVNAAGKLPPAYPEVTLHPVPGSEATPGTSHGNSSLLHGILTKSPLRPDARLSPFSPTLARLLTAPERVVSHNSTVYQRATMTTAGCINSTANITVSATSGINLSLGQTRSEITITPLPPNTPASLVSDLTSNSSSIGVMSTTANKPEIMNLDDYEADDSNGRLVIDEEELDGGDHNGAGNAVDDVEVSEVTDGVSVPACQGCNRLEAHYVCAGCGNQWYCSRECQVKAWEVHSEVCKG